MSFVLYLNTHLLLCRETNSILTLQKTYTIDSLFILIYKTDAYKKRMIHTNFDIQQKMLLKDTFQLGHRQSKENILKNIQFLCSYVRIYVSIFYLTG